jgi:hypothetical protein
MPDESTPETPDTKPKKPEEMKLTANEQDHFRELIGDTDNVAREMAAIELRKSELVDRLKNLVLDQKRMQEKIQKRLGLTDGQFNIDIEKGTVVPAGGMVRRTM